MAVMAITQGPAPLRTPRQSEVLIYEKNRREMEIKMEREKKTNERGRGGKKKKGIKKEIERESQRV